MFGIKSLNEMLFEAMHCDDGVKKAKVLIEQGVNIHIMDFKGWNPLHHAAYYGQVKNIGWLLNQGFDINRRTCGGKTPLTLAWSTSNIAAVKFLKMKGGE